MSAEAKAKEAKAKEIPTDNGGVTDEQIRLWKSKHRKVYEIIVVDDSERFVGYFHRPDMDTVSVINKLAKTDEIKAALALFENCWLGGSTVMREDVLVKMDAISQLNAIKNAVSSEIKNV